MGFCPKCKETSNDNLILEWDCPVCGIYLACIDCALSDVNANAHPVLTYTDPSYLMGLKQKKKCKRHG
jgi:hypothetical protein